MQNKTFIIDLDGTLIQGQSQRYLIEYLRKVGKISFFKYFVILSAFVLYKLSLYKNAPQLLRYSLNNFEGETENEINNDVDVFFDECLKGKYFKYAKEMITLIQQSGGNIIILSAIVNPLVKRISEDLNIPNYISTLLEYDENKIFTGNMIGSQVYANNKLVSIKKYLSENNISEENVTVITDHISDIPVIKNFKHSIIANPNSVMKKWARQNNYPIIYLDNNESIQYIKHYIESK